MCLLASSLSLMCYPFYSSLMQRPQLIVFLLPSQWCLDIYSVGPASRFNTLLYPWQACIGSFHHDQGQKPVWGQKKPTSAVPASTHPETQPIGMINRCAPVYNEHCYIVVMTSTLHTFIIKTIHMLLRYLFCSLRWSWTDQHTVCQTGRNSRCPWSWCWDHIGCSPVHWF